MLDAETIYRRHRHLFGIVPDDSLPFARQQCIGPTDETFIVCLSCQRLSADRDLSRALAGRIIPMTAALSPSPGTPVSPPTRPAGPSTAGSSPS